MKKNVLTILSTLFLISCSNANENMVLENIAANITAVETHRSGREPIGLNESKYRSPDRYINYEPIRSSKTTVCKGEFYTYILESSIMQKDPLMFMRSNQRGTRKQNKKQGWQVTHDFKLYYKEDSIVYVRNYYILDEFYNVIFVENKEVAVNPSIE